MVDIPQFFNRIDFVGTILPGYIAVVLSLALFSTDLFVIEEDDSISADLFTSIVFLVAGPAIGLLIQGVHRSLYAIYDRIKNGGENRSEFVMQYEEVRINSSAEEKLELDSTEAWYDFLISTASVLLLIGVYYVFTQSAEPVIAGLIFGVCIVFFINGRIEWEEGYTAIYRTLAAKHTHTRETLEGSRSNKNEADRHNHE